MMNEQVCELCEREVPSTTRHHLIPRTVHKNKWFKKKFEKEQLHETIDLCKACHRQIHKFISHKDLGRFFNTREKLLSHDQVGGFVTWLRKRDRVVDK
jgi:hypothetical protein